MTSTLWRRIQSSQVRTLAVMGMTKNTGKTVVLNHLLAQAAACHASVGVTSIGRDGEERDQVFLVPKPPVRVWPGTLVATARDTLQRAKLRWKLIDATGIDSPMGEILLVKALDAGTMEVAGASRGADQRRVISRLQQCGADLVLLDGALGRSQHASPAIADGVILATGAALGGAMVDVIRKTRERLAILGIAQADDALRQLCGPVFEGGGVGVWGAHGQQLFLEPISTLNSAEVLVQSSHVAITTIAVSGAVGRKLWQALSTLATANQGLTVLVNDGTRLFVSAADLAAFAALGAHLRAYHGIRLMGITLNPCAVSGVGFEPQEFLGAARHAFSGYSVTDVMLEDRLMAAELGSDPNSGHGSRVNQQRLTEMGSDPTSAGHTEQVERTT